MLATLLRHLLPLIVATALQDPASAPTERSLREDIGRIETTAALERNLNASLAQLDDLADAVITQAQHAPTSIDTVALLGQVEIARAKLLTSMGRKSPKQELIAWAKNIETRYAALDTALVQALLESLNSERLITEGVLIRGAEPAERDAVEEAVRGFVERKYEVGLRSFGVRAVPTLRKIVLEDLEAFPGEWQQDALYWLAELDELAAGELVLQELERGGSLWRSRVIRSMSIARVLRESDAWQYGGGFPCSSLRPHWISVVEQLLGFPDSANDAILLLKPVVAHGAVSAAMNTALIAALERGDTRSIGALIGALEADYRVDAVRPVLDAAVNHENDTVRIFAAGQLVHFEDGWRSLQVRASDPIVAVRAAVVRSLKSRRLATPRVQPNGRIDTASQNVDPVTTPRSLELLAVLAQDPVDSIRLDVLGVMVHRGDALPVEVYASLAQDSSVEVRRELADKGLHALAFDDLVRVLSILLADPDAATVGKAAKQLETIDWARGPEQVLALLEGLWSSDARQGYFKKTKLLSQALDNPAGQGAIAEWLGRVQDQGLVALVFDALREETLAPEHAARLALVSWPVEPELCSAFVYAVGKRAQARQQRALMDLAQATDTPVGLSFFAACAAGPDQGGFVRTVVKSLSNPFWWTDPLAREEWLQAALRRRLTSDDVAKLRNAVLLDLVRNPAVDDDHLSPLVRVYPTGPVNELATAIVARWSESPSPAARQALCRALSAAGPGAEIPLDFLARALTEPDLGQCAVELAQKVRHPAVLGALRELLVTPGPRPLWRSAAHAVGNYMNDEAATVLIEAAGYAQNQEDRDICLAWLESIRKFQDAKERWATRRVSHASREEAILELFEMLGSENVAVRGQSARALATLGALEALPRLIRMLEDPAPEVQQAAAEALERLHHLEDEERGQAE